LSARKTGAGPDSLLAQTYKGVAVILVHFHPIAGGVFGALAATAEAHQASITPPDNWYDLNRGGNSGSLLSSRCGSSVLLGHNVKQQDTTSPG